MGHSLLALENRLQAEEATTGGHQETPSAIEEGAKGGDSCEPEENQMTEESRMMINYITDRPLRREEKQLIYELTMKKRQSKKSTMSEKQQLAREQLANELRLERRDRIDIDSIRYATQNTSLSRSYSLHLDDLYERASSAASSFCDTDKDSCCGSKLHPKLSTASTAGSCGGASFSGSERSYEARGQQQQQPESSLVAPDREESPPDNPTEISRSKSSAIRLKKLKLEQLSAELETRLYQYEYLVAQEKALLSSYNMMLFTNKGVNNFNLTQDPL